MDRWHHVAAMKIKSNWKSFILFLVSVLCCFLGILSNFWWYRHKNQLKWAFCHRRIVCYTFYHFPLRAICTGCCAGRGCTCSACWILMMVFESACVSSHIQDKEKVAAAVTTSSVFLLMLVMGSQLLSDTSTSSGAVSALLTVHFCWCECFFVFYLLFWIQQHSHGSTNSTFRKIDL